MDQDVPPSTQEHMQECRTISTGSRGSSRMETVLQAHPQEQLQQQLQQLLLRLLLQHPQLLLADKIITLTTPCIPIMGDSLRHCYNASMIRFKL